MRGSLSESVLGVSDKGNSGCKSAIVGTDGGLFIVLVAIAVVVLAVIVAAVVRRVKRKSAVKAETARENVALKESNVSAVSEPATDTVASRREAARCSSI